MPQSQGSKRLLLFHHAGGSGGQYFAALKPFAQDCEVQCLDLPGRFFRLDEPPVATMSDLIFALRKQLAELPPLPTYVLGHSFGALVAYALAWEIHREMPLRGITFSALRSPSPENRLSHERISAMDDVELLAEIEKFSELPNIVKREPTILGLTLKALRADFTVMASFKNTHSHERLPVPSLVFGGARDPQVPPPELEGWKNLVETKKNPQILPGDHFYIFSQMETVLKDLFQI